MPPVLQRALKEIGLGDKEATVLLVLLEHGLMLAAAVAKAAGLNRTTTYGILKELMEKGLVSSVKKEGATRYQSIDPEMLPAYIKRRLDTLAATEKELATIVPQINLLRNKNRVLPKVKFFEGIEGVKQAYEETLNLNKEKKLRNIVGLDNAHARLEPHYVDNFLKKRVALGVFEEYLMPDSAHTRAYAAEDRTFARTGKLMPAKYNMNTEISIYDNKVAIFSFAQESPVAIIIEDDTIAQTMKTLFAYMESASQKQ
jgi:sugar-specific transcriptional regulator TrmB